MSAPGGAAPPGLGGEFGMVDQGSLIQTGIPSLGMRGGEYPVPVRRALLSLRRENSPELGEAHRKRALVVALGMAHRQVLTGKALQKGRPGSPTDSFLARHNHRYLRKCKISTNSVGNIEKPSCRVGIKVPHCAAADGRKSA